MFQSRRSTIEQWLPAEASVFSVGFTERAGQTGNATGHYHVVFSYSVDGRLYMGKFADYGMAQESYLHPGDTIQIRYNPEHPEQNLYPALRSDKVRDARMVGVYIAFGIAAITAIIALLTAHH